MPPPSATIPIKANPPARLAERPGDERLSLSQLQELSVFEGLRQPQKLGEFPGAFILRRYNTNDAIVRQGEPGWTAFYVLTTTDLLELRESQRKQAEQDGDQDRVSQLNQRIEDLQNRNVQAQQLGEDESRELKAVATVVFAPPPAPKRPWWERALFGRKSGGQDGGGHPKMIFSDADINLALDSSEAVLFEGDVFGEMSCLYRTPRAATIVADRECYVLEMLRNIYDKVNSGRFRKQMEDIYFERVMGYHLRNHPFFRMLEPDEFAAVEPEVRKNATLKTFRPGEFICDEFERSDAIYIIRRGFVKVAKNVSCLLWPGAIKNWSGLCQALLPETADAESDGPQAHLAKKFDDSNIAAAIRRSAKGEGIDKNEQLEICHLINDDLSDKGGLWSVFCQSLVHGQSDEAVQPKRSVWLRLSAEAQKQLQKAAKGGEIEAQHLHHIVEATNHQFAQLSASENTPFCDLGAPIELDEYVLAGFTRHQQLRYLNRLILQAIHPDVVPMLSWNGPPRTIVYRQRGEFIGEIGLISDTTRTATCLAYDHPTGKFGDVEVVRIDADLFNRLITKSAKLKSAIQRVAQQRHTEVDRASAVSIDMHGSPGESTRFEELGLVQGNRLMLIDLDRCTRCDECVRACIQTHRGGNHDIPGTTSRLYLDGPRHGQFLVPATCRQCTDPVCLIGCPVGSIHKGDLGQIVIEDWCIGCTRCAEQCPYDAIQMHKVGIVQRGGGDWRYCATPGTPGPREEREWYEADFPRHDWLIGQSPFRFDFALRSTLNKLPEAGERLFFRLVFSLSEWQMEGCSEYLLQIESEGDSVEAWLNHRLLELSSHPQAAKGKAFTDRGYTWQFQATVVTDDGTDNNEPTLRVGDNIVAVAVAAPSTSGQTMLDLGLYAQKKGLVNPIEIGEEEPFVEDLVMQKAVVCDMCASTRSQIPACVAACPHDAAWRGLGLASDSPMHRGPMSLGQ